MEIRPATSQDKDIWNDYVYAHPQGTPYHNFAWPESARQAYKHQNVSLLALRDKSVVGVLPAVAINIPLKGKLVCSLPFCDLGHGLADSAEIVNLLLSEMQQLHGDAIRFEYRDTALQSNETEAISLAENIKVRMLLAMPGSSEELLAGFKSKLRSQVKKAEKNGLRVKTSRAPDEQMLDDFYQIFALNMRTLGSPVHGKHWFRAIRNNYQQDMLLACVYFQDTPVGGGIVLLNKQRAAIPWASTVPAYNKLAPNMLLYWSLLAYCADNGITEFDFGRSTFGEGTYKFKQQWGALAVPLEWRELSADKLATGGSDKQVAGSGRLRQTVEFCWSHLPLAITTTVGPALRKYISL